MTVADLAEAGGEINKGRLEGQKWGQGTSVRVLCPELEVRVSVREVEGLGETYEGRNYSRWSLKSLAIRKSEGQKNYATLYGGATQPLIL